jgi:hypothetical protein
MTAILSLGPGHKDLARQILEHQAPEYKFAFTPFLLQTYRHGISPNRPVCKAWSQGHCPLVSSCPDKHTATNSNSRFDNSLVCKHWLRGLCKKGDTCEFLHEYNLRKMPECNFFTRNGYCSNGGLSIPSLVSQHSMLTLPRGMFIPAHRPRQQTPALPTLRKGLLPPGTKLLSKTRPQNPLRILSCWILS